jgi:hypothetical protein
VTKERGDGVGYSSDNGRCRVTAITQPLRQFFFFLKKGKQFKSCNQTDPIVMNITVFVLLFIKIQGH